MYGRYAALGLIALGMGCSPEDSGGPPPERPPAEVTVATPRVERIVEWDAYTGRLGAVESVELRSRVSGYLQSVHFEEGQDVKQGDVLFVVDPRPFEVALELAKAARKQAEARLIVAGADETKAKADRGRVLAQLELARIQEQRARNLEQEGTSSQELLDERRSQLSQAEAQLATADAGIASAHAATALAEADVAAALVSVEQAKLDLSYTQVRAPVSGRADQHLITVGNFVQGGAASGTLLTTIVSVDPIHCYFDANEQSLMKYIRMDKTGERKSSREVKNPVYMRVVDESGYPHQGHMDFVGNQVDVDTATIRGRAIFANPDGVLQVGLFARVRLPGSAPYDAMLIPDAAVGADQSERFVLVVNAEGTVERRTVTLGPLHGGLRIVRAGLGPDERMIVEGVQLARPGDTVKVVESEVQRPAQPADALPNSYEPVPRAKWLGKSATPAPVSTETPAQEPR